MRLWPGAERGLRALGALALLLCAASADTREEVAALFSEARLGEAFAATAGIEDDALRAEWRFHLLYTGGDLPGALAAARTGLEAAPDHPGLLANATRCATLLGLGAEALDWAEHLAALPGPADETSEQGQDRVAGAAALVAEAGRIAELERAGAAGRERALLVALGGLVLSLCALLLLARGRQSRSSTP